MYMLHKFNINEGLYYTHRRSVRFKRRNFCVIRYFMIFAILSKSLILLCKAARLRCYDRPLTERGNVINKYAATV